MAKWGNTPDKMLAKGESKPQHQIANEAWAAYVRSDAFKADLANARGARFIAYYPSQPRKTVHPVAVIISK